MIRGGGESLISIIRQVCSELCPEPAGDVGSLASPEFGGHGRHPTHADPGAADEAGVGKIRLALAELAAAACGGELAADRERLVAVALGGVELLIRGQLTIGRPERLQELLPGVVFLVALAATEEDRALSISRRAEELVEVSGAQPDASRDDEDAPGGTRTRAARLKRPPL